MSSAGLITRSPHLASPIACALRPLRAIGRSSCALVREWRHRSRSRWELSIYSYDERKDLGYAAELDAELGKPFWRK
jgi:uncharacterized protein YjiS (DUF1127 family)